LDNSLKTLEATSLEARDENYVHEFFFVFSSLLPIFYNCVYTTEMSIFHSFPMAEELLKQWCDPTPSSSSTNLDSEVSVTPQPKKKSRTEEEDEPNYEPGEEAHSARTTTLPVVPRTLEFEEEQERDEEPPSPSMSTPSNKSRGQKTKMRRGNMGGTRWRR
jgi:hypothetical protein